jgi:acyl dehydratase
MPIDPNAVGVTSGPREVSWSDRDTMLYAIGVGAGLDELAFTTDNSHGITQQVLPTYGVIICSGGVSVLAKAGDINWGKLVHGTQSVRLHQPLPAAGKLSVTAEISDIQDKGEGKNAIIALTAKGVDEAGTLVVETTMSVVIRGSGGFGGQPGASVPKVEFPDREPDVTHAETTRDDQALIYRLSGDRNPLHSDPWFATEKAGFPKPILHGLCSYGFTGRALLHGLCDGDPARFGAMSARFSSPVFPGETLTTRAWKIDDKNAVFRTSAAGPDGANDRVVIDGGVLELA